MNSIDKMIEECRDRQPAPDQRFFRKGCEAGDRASGEYGALTPEDLYIDDQLEHELDRKIKVRGGDLLVICNIKPHIVDEASRVESAHRLGLRPEVLNG